eukprot:1160384-Pelagomonas_calceolata.AAC.7
MPAAGCAIDCHPTMGGHPACAHACRATDCHHGRAPCMCTRVQCQTAPMGRHPACARACICQDIYVCRQPTVCTLSS